MNCVSPSGCISSLQSHQKAKALPLPVPSLGLLRAVGFVAGTATGHGHACLLVRLALAYTAERAVPPFLLLCFAGRGGLQLAAPQGALPRLSVLLRAAPGARGGLQSPRSLQKQQLALQPRFFFFFFTKAWAALAGQNHRALVQRCASSRR